MSFKEREEVRMKKIVKVLGISAMMAAAMAISASAATITNVKFACGAPEDDTITDGYTSPEFTAAFHLNEGRGPVS